MIAYLKGYIKYKGEGYVVVDVNSVGYKVEVIKSLLSLEIDSIVELYIYSDINERLSRLFGFPSIEYLNLFELLLTVTGVGPKSALNILSNCEYNELIGAINRADLDLLLSIPGLGKKSAERIILELKGKVLGIDIVSNPRQQFMKEVAAALLSLGYNSTEIKKIESQLLETDSINDALRKGLSLLKK